MDVISLTQPASSLSYLSSQTLTEISLFLPRLFGALLILVIGAAIAKACKRIVVKVLEAMMVSKLLRNTPIEHFIQNTEVSQKAEEIVGSVVYWLIMLIVVHTTVAVLGLAPVSAVLDQVLGYIPNIFSAVLVLFFGLLLAGVVESLVKAAIKSIDGKSSRLLAKIASYLVVTISVLVAVSELGIAREFITILFVGFVAMLALGIGLAVGLGGQDIVRLMLKEWYEKTRKEVQE